MSEIAFPFHLDSRGRTAGSTEDAHLEELIAQILFTTPGERVNRPTFGSGLMQLAFAPLSNELAAAVQFQVQGALHQWLGNRIQVQAVDVETGEATVRITVRYAIPGQPQPRQVDFTRGF